MDVKLDRRALLGAGLTLGTLGSRAHAQARPDEDSAVSLTTAVKGGYDGSAGQAADQRFFPGWKRSVIETPGLSVDGLTAKGAAINTLVGGNGPPLLLIHGNPETHVAWHKVAPTLAKAYTVVLTDLRGYGDSSKPDGGQDHVDYCKRVMAQDQVTVMRSLGFNTFQAMAHDRGALQPMMSIYPAAVTRGVMLDIAPTSGMYEHTSEAFATKYFWWFLQIQDSPCPEDIINPAVRHCLDYHLNVQCKTPGAITREAYAEHLRCYGDPATVHGVCEGYRASATVDRRLDAVLNERKISQPLLALWGAKGTVGQPFDVIPMWREVADDVAGQALPCGHLVAEEVPDQLLAALKPFLQA